MSALQPRGYRSRIPLAAVFALAVSLLFGSARADDGVEFLGRMSPNFFAELQDVELANGRAYIFGVGGFVIMDIDDPAQPMQIGRYEPPGHPYVRYYRGAVGVNYGFGGAREDRLHVFDMNSESNPHLISTYGDVGMSYEGMAFRDDLLFACRHNDGVEIIDVSSPFVPVQMSEILALTNSWDIHLAGDYAYVADGSGGLAILDISNPVAPVLLYSLPTGGAAVDVDVDGGLALVACGSAGVDVFDVTDPLNAFWVGNYNSSGLAITVDATDGKGYIADWDDIEIMDLSTPESPSRLAWENTPVRAMGLAAEGNTVYVADWSRFLVYEQGATFTGDLDLSIERIDMAAVPVGESADTTFFVINTGGGVLPITNIESFNENFEVLPPISFMLDPGESRKVTLRFTPDAPGFDATFINVEAADTDEPNLTFPITADDDPSALDIGEVATAFILIDMDGVYHKLSDYLGKVVVLAFFANW